MSHFNSLFVKYKYLVRLFGHVQDYTHASHIPVLGMTAARRPNVLTAAIATISL
jgi:hypothetical protein